MRLAIADQTQRQRIKTHQWQAGVELQLAGFRHKHGPEYQPADADPQHLRGAARQQKTQAADGGIVHRHHGNGGGAGQRVEVHRDHPKAPHEGVYQQVTVFRMIGARSATRPLESQVRPEQAVE
ncbi:hypothetical protein D3C84_808950 [compost metagenome]